MIPDLCKTRQHLSNDVCIHIYISSYTVNSDSDIVIDAPDNGPFNEQH